MSNNEPRAIQNQQATEQDKEAPAHQPVDQYEQLLNEGKEVLDRIQVSHASQEDTFLISRKQQSSSEDKQKNEGEAEAADKKQSSERDGENQLNEDSKIQAQGESKNSLDQSQNLAKRSSKVFNGCNCIKSRCTKNYCECFTQARKCTQICKCTGCQNQGEVQKKYRNPIEMSDVERTCNCKKSNCLKKYCECFNSGAKCTSSCKCEECRNNNDGPMDHEWFEDPKEQPKNTRSPEQLTEINSKIDEIAKLVPQEQQEYILSFLEYWLA